MIDRTNLENIRVRVGEPIKLDVKITGEPIPDKSWKLASKELKSTASMTITYEDYKTKFLIVSAKRQDSGTYFIKAQNKNGVDEAEVGMLVVGPPMPPTGPLKIEDVFEDRCKVEYKLPKDDGGSPITHYIIEKMDVEIGTWAVSYTHLRAHETRDDVV